MDTFEPYTLETMTECHGAEIVRILNHYIQNGFIVSYDEPFADSYIKDMLESTKGKGYPAFTAKDERGHVVGFCFLRPYNPAPTMKRTAEIAYMIHPDHMRKGLGTLMLERLKNEAVSLGADNLIASILSRNEESLSFHKKHGFRQVGHLEAVGEKFGKDFGIIYMQLRI